MIPMPFRFRAWCLLCLWAVQAAAGVPATGRMVFRAFGPAEGLEHTSLTALAQDASGFLWAGTEGGAYRFDGTSFRLWSLPEGLPSAWVRAFAPSPGGGLWIGTRAGLCLMKEGKIRKLDPSDPLASARINGILSDPQGRIWVAADPGLFWSPGPDRRFESVPGWPSEPAYALALGVEGLWAGGASALRCRGEAGLWRDWGPREGLPAEAVKALLSTPDGSLWIRTPGQLRVLRPGSPRLVPPAAGLPPLHVSFYEESLQLDGGGGVFAPTAKGLLHFPATGGWRLLGEGRSLPGGWANQALVDRAGNLWVASVGLHRLQGHGAWENLTRLDGLPADNTWGLMRDRKGVLWIGTSAGLAQMDAKGLRAFGPAKGLVLYALAEGPDGSIWGGGEHPFLVRIPPGRGAAARIPVPRAPNPAIPLALSFDREGDLWMATSNQGLWRLADPGGRPAFHAARLPGGQDLGQVSALHQDGRGRLWAATGRGLARLDQGRWKLWGQACGLHEAPLWALAPLPDGTAWLSYLEPLGLTRVDLRGEEPRVLEHLTRKQGLASDSVYSLAADASGTLWIGGPRGVQRMSAGALRLFGREDGLAGTDCNPFSTWVDGDGSVWFGTTAGLLHHRPYPAAPPPAPPETTFVSLSLGDRTWDEPRSGQSDLGAAPYRARTLSARFTSLAFQHEGRLRFQARLAGQDEAWIDLQGRNLRYTGLPPGHYRLEVRALIEGEPPGPVASARFRVQSPWWFRWWAWALWASLALCAGLAAFRWRTLRLQRRNEELETLVYQRTEALELSNLALATISTTDPLTGLRNRRYLEDRLPEVLALALRARHDRSGASPASDACLVFALVDVDHFKRVNDTWSHAAGDMALRQIADRLRREARESDFLIRWGGEEFLFVGPTSDLDGAAAAVARLHQAIRTHPFDLGLSAPVDLTCSIGFALFPFQPDHMEAASWEDHVRVADRCLYGAKRSGRDGWAGAAGLPGQPVGLARRFERAPAASADLGAVALRASFRKGPLIWE